MTLGDATKIAGKTKQPKLLHMNAICSTYDVLKDSIALSLRRKCRKFKDDDVLFRRFPCKVHRKRCCHSIVLQHLTNCSIRVHMVLGSNVSVVNQQ